MDIGYLTGKPMKLADPPLLFFILFVIDDFVWSRLRKKIGDLGFFFFFFACYGLLMVVVVVVVLVVVVGVANGRGGCGWCCGCFLDSEIYYFIVMFILFYYIES